MGRLPTELLPVFVKLLELAEPLSFVDRRRLVRALEIVLKDAEADAKFRTKPQRHRRRNTK